MRTHCWDGRVPPGLVDRRARPHVGTDAVAVGAPLQIGQDLRLGGVGAAPPRVGLERVRVEVGGDVARRPRVGVVPPGPTHPVGLLVEGERIAGPPEPDAHGDAPGAGAEDGDGRLRPHRGASRPRLAEAPESTSSTSTPSGSRTVAMATPDTSTCRGDPGQAQPGQPVQRRGHVGEDRQQQEPRPGRRGDRRTGQRPEVHQLHDAGVGRGRVAQEDRPQPVGRGLQQGGPVAPEPLVHQHGEAQAVAPEPQALLHVPHADGRMVHHGHGPTPMVRPGPEPTAVVR